jgi:uncharacterized protein YodC (DUF2158 family)
MSTATLDAIEIPAIAPLNVGDVVALKSGGPRMTVTYVGPVALTAGEWVVCQWFDEHGELRQEMFEPEQVSLEPRSIPPGSVHLGRFGRRAAQHG